MVLQCGPGRTRPGSEVGILAAFTISLEEIDSIFMHIFLITAILLCKILALQPLELIKHFLMIFGKRSRGLCRAYFRAQELLQFIAGLLVIGDHLLRKALRGWIGLCQREFARFDLEHVAASAQCHKVLGGRR